MKYAIWNGLWREYFDNKVFDTEQEAEDYFYSNLQRIYEICQDSNGKPLDAKDYFFIEPYEEER